MQLSVCGLRVVSKIGGVVDCVEDGACVFLITKDGQYAADQLTWSVAHCGAWMENAQCARVRAISQLTRAEEVLIHTQCGRKSSIAAFTDIFHYRVLVQGPGCLNEFLRRWRVPKNILPCESYLAELFSQVDTRPLLPPTLPHEKESVIGR